MTVERIWVLVLACFCCTACSQDKPSTPAKPAAEVRPEAAPAAKASPAATPAGGEFVAFVNGIPVTREEFLVYIEPYPARMKDNVQGREHLLKELIDQILLEGEANRLGLDRDPEYRRKVAGFRRNLLNNMLLDTSNEEDLEVTNQECKEYFDAHPAEFDHPERVHVRHILLATEEEANEVLARIRAGESFEELARQKSKDAATGPRGGDLGVFSRKQRPNLAEAAFSLARPGMLAGPVMTPRGYHLLQLVRRIPAEKDTFEKVGQSLLGRLRARKRQEAKKSLLDKLRKSGQIKLNREALESLEVAPGER